MLGATSGYSSLSCKYCSEHLKYFPDPQNGATTSEPRSNTPWTMSIRQKTSYYNPGGYRVWLFAPTLTGISARDFYSFSQTFPRVMMTTSKSRCPVQLKTYMSDIDTQNFLILIICIFEKMVPTVLKPKTKKAVSKPSRKGKKAWRKNVDISEVEEALEKIRDEEITLGGKISDISTEKLFSIDVKGDSEVKKKVDKKSAKLHIDLILENRSKIPEVFSKPRPNYGKNHTSKYAKMMLEKLAKKKNQVGNSANNNESSEIVMKTGEYDVWAQADDQSEDFSHSILKQKIRPPPTLNMKPAVNTPAVHLPHSGSSYMPSFKDHQELLMIAHEEEVVKLKKTERINSKLPCLIEQRKAQKDLVKKLEKLPEIIKTVENECADHEKKMVERTKLAEEVTKMPKKKIGKYRVRKAPIDVKLTEDLEGTLRLLKPEGNLLRDRMISYEERNIIEPRVPVSKKRKYKLKEYVRNSYKNP
ncbi:10559_t:CDS:10 [Dentiscutata erythropus]|uniref:Ribosome biogenesis protein NOP53 n=1 Tax=Dentiscutata erythropus TaxID=1348616 RepID=A0A9N9D0Q5_9GLOM|nr:10559_t:CDS:10 [Dentiscutata erythropus]